MSNIKAAITGIHGWVPDYVLSNQELETMVDTNDEWITTRTGIKERRILKGEGLGTSDIGAEAAKGLLEKKGLSAEDIDLIICATATPDMLFPSTACIIADKIGATNAFGFDLMALQILICHYGILYGFWFRFMIGLQEKTIYGGMEFECQILFRTP